MKKKISVILITILFLSCLPNLKKNNRRDFNSNVVFALGSDVEKSGYSLKESLFDDEKVWVSNEAVITNENISEMYFEEEDVTGQMRLNISLHSDSASHFGDFTEKNIGKNLCIVSGGYVIVNAVIHSHIRGSISVTGAFTKEKIDQLLGDSDIP